MKVCSTQINPCYYLSGMICNYTGLISCQSLLFPPTCKLYVYQGQKYEENSVKSMSIYKAAGNKHPDARSTIYSGRVYGIFTNQFCNLISNLILYNSIIILKKVVMTYNGISTF